MRHRNAGLWIVGALFLTGSLLAPQSSPDNPEESQPKNMLASVELIEPAVEMAAAPPAAPAEPPDVSPPESNAEETEAPVDEQAEETKPKEKRKRKRPPKLAANERPTPTVPPRKAPSWRVAKAAPSHSTGQERSSGATKASKGTGRPMDKLVGPPKAEQAGPSRGSRGSEDGSAGVIGSGLSKRRIPEYKKHKTRRAKKKARKPVTSGSPEETKGGVI